MNGNNQFASSFVLFLDPKGRYYDRIYHINWLLANFRSFKIIYRSLEKKALRAFVVAGALIEHAKKAEYLISFYYIIAWLDSDSDSGNCACLFVQHEPL